VFSVVLFYAGKVHIFKTDTFQASVTYTFIQPWGPKAIDMFGAAIPLFKGMFEELSRFFESIHPEVK